MRTKQKNTEKNVHLKQKDNKSTNSSIHNVIICKVHEFIYEKRKEKHRPRRNSRIKNTYTPSGLDSRKKLKTIHPKKKKQKVRQENDEFIRTRTEKPWKSRRNNFKKLNLIEFVEQKRKQNSQRSINNHNAAGKNSCSQKKSECIHKTKNKGINKCPQN